MLNIDNYLPSILQVVTIINSTVTTTLWPLRDLRVQFGDNSFAIFYSDFHLYNKHAISKDKFK